MAALWFCVYIEGLAILSLNVQIYFIEQCMSVMFTMYMLTRKQNNEPHSVLMVMKASNLNADTIIAK